MENFRLRMVARSLETEMPGGRLSSRVDTLELKSQIERKIGRVKAEKYFNLLTRFLSLKIAKPEFDRLCICTIGRENIRLHNHLLRSIIRNATFSKIPPSRENKFEGSLSVKVPNGYQRGGLQSLCKDFPQSPRRGRTPNLRDRKFRDRPSPLGPHGKSHSTVCEDATPKVQEQQSATELLSLGSRPPGSVEDGEEVDQAAGSPSVYSRSPVRAPFGISLNAKGMRKVPLSGMASASETCHCRGELPDSGSLRKRLEQKLEMEGVNISVECANLLNNSLDVYLKRLIKPCLELAGSRSGQNINKAQNWSMASLNGMRPVRYAQKQSGSVSASMLDFRVAMELNPPVLGAEWPTQLEKTSTPAIVSASVVSRRKRIANLDILANTTAAADIWSARRRRQTKNGLIDDLRLGLCMTNERLATNNLDMLENDSHVVPANRQPKFSVCSDQVFGSFF